jgi:hypothetical protein
MDVAAAAGIRLHLLRQRFGSGYSIVATGGARDCDSAPAVWGAS